MIIVGARWMTIDQLECTLIKNAPTYYANYYAISLNTDFHPFNMEYGANNHPKSFKGVEKQFCFVFR